MKSRTTFLKLPAYNLQETLIVLLIIGILISMAIPMLMPLVTKAKSIEAQTHLGYIYNSQTSYRYLYSKYANNFNEIDFEAPNTVLDNGKANYRYEILSANPTSFKARATAVVDFDGDGIYNVWEIDENGIPKQIIKD